MSEQQIQLTGSKALIVGVLIVGLMALRSFNAATTLDTQGRDTLQEWVMLELQRPILADESLSLEAKGEAVLKAGNVRIASMKAKGPMDDLVVRIELEPSPDLPPGTELVRYYRMEYSTITGWRHRGNATALSYYIKIY